MNNFKFFNFSNVQKDFLNTYSPKDEIFTSIEEMEKIIDVLELKMFNDVEVLRSIRNSVVLFYRDLFYYINDNGEKQLSKDFWKYNTGMMSVTAVIDNYMFSIKPSSI